MLLKNNHFKVNFKQLFNKLHFLKNRIHHYLINWKNLYPCFLFRNIKIHFYNITKKPSNYFIRSCHLDRISKYLWPISLKIINKSINNLQKNCIPSSRLPLQNIFPLLLKLLWLRDSLFKLRHLRPIDLGIVREEGLNQEIERKIMR